MLLFLYSYIHKCIDHCNTLVRTENIQQSETITTKLKGITCAKHVIEPLNKQTGISRYSGMPALGENMPSVHVWLRLVCYVCKSGRA